jgi:non-specific serine/threonine protein kinase
MLETLSHLVDKSLVTVSQLESGKTRYDLLETIRQYALEKLTGSDEVEDSKIRHLNYFLRWAEGAAPHVDEQGQLAWLADYEADHDNLRAALAWCRAADDKAQAGLRLAAACGRFWRLHGHISEGRTHLSAALAQRGAEKRNAARAWALFRAGVLAYFQSDLPAIHPIAEEALSIWRELGKEGRAGAASTLRLLGELATEEGDYARAPKYFQEAIEIYKDLNDKRGIGDMFLEFGWLFMRLGDMPQAVGYLEEALALGREIGEIHLQLYAYSGLGEAAVRRGQYDRASAMLEQGFALNREMNDRWESGAITGSLGWVALRRGDFKRMRVILRESLSIRVELEDKGGIAWCLEKLAEAAALTGERQKAARIYGAASALRAPLASAIDPADQPDYDRIISSLRSALNVETFAALWAEGESMPLDQVVEYALSEPGPSSASSRAGKEKSGGLTPREREVAALIAQGKSNREIAEQMTVGVRTVETYVTRILAKLGFDSRVQIATWAWEKGLK